MQPFAMQTSDAVLADLRSRLMRTRWPDDPDAEPWLHGTDGAYLRELVDYWIHHFDWRAQERALHRFAHFRATVDGFGIHFIHRPNGVTPSCFREWGHTFVLSPINKRRCDPTRHGRARRRKGRSTLRGAE
jgi:hypothetical protein